MSVSDVELRLVEEPDARFFAKLRQSYAAHGLHLGMALLYLSAFLVSALLVEKVGIANAVFDVLAFVIFSIPLAFMAMVVLQFYFVATVDKSQTPVKDLWRRIKAVVRHEDTLVRGVPMYTALLIHMYVFTAFKANISNLQPFVWDVTLDQWDKALHFGTRPWEWLQPILGNLPATLVLNFNYNLWFFVMTAMWVYFAFIRAPGVERTRYYVAFMLITAVVGSGFAGLLSSVGPCFYHHLVGGENPYAPLMAQLRGFHTIMPVWAIDTQDMLWTQYSLKSAIGGISAMPSVHNATGLLVVLVTWNWARPFRYAAIVHCVLIFLGSIMLGWHYALDSYIAWPLALLCWYVSGPIARWWNDKPHVVQFNQRYVTNV
jgi:PAP2 superfamily